MKINCTRCQKGKDATSFYKNTKKLNGLDSQCKDCILNRKSTKYKAVTLIKKKKNASKLRKAGTVLNIDSCIFKTVRLNIIFPEQKKILTDELVRGILCHLKK